MKYIDKRLENEPQSLKDHKNTPHHFYDNYADKDALRKALLNEQGYLCCYCMRKIQGPTEDKMKIEHFKPFSIYNGINGKPDLTLKYDNLLASCKGDEGMPKNLHHCDKTKKHSEIKLNPTNKSLMDLVKFTANGTVFTEKEDLDNEIDNILKLNIPLLKNERKAIWESLEQIIKNQFGNKTVTKSFINDKIKIWQRKNQSGMSEQYSQVAIYYLTKKLKQVK
jgi:uncharacterized protein (TIGR02646 family)